MIGDAVPAVPVAAMNRSEPRRATGLPVMAIGGFSGGDPILDRDGFAARVRAGEVRYVIIDDRLRGDIRELVRARCSAVPEQEWRQRPVQGGPAQQPGQAVQLYDCGAMRG